MPMNPKEQEFFNRVSAWQERELSSYFNGVFQNKREAVCMANLIRSHGWKVELKDGSYQEVRIWRKV